MMNLKSIAAISLAAAAAFTLNSCETATGTGALVGAATGAAIGGSSWHHSGEHALAGAAIGAGAGALIGAAIDQQNATRYGPPREDYPYGRHVGPGMYQSPYPPHQVYNLRGVPHGALVDDPVGRGYFRKP